MNANELKDVYSAAPFQPFEIVLTNGARVLVDHPEFMAFSPDYRTVFVSKRNGGVQGIDVKLVIVVDDAKNGARSRKRRR